jgi:cytochrome b561
MPTSEAPGRAIARYHPLLRLLHWLTVVLIVFMFIIGGWIVYFDPGDGPLKDRLYNLHESTGMLLWLLVLARIVLRLATGAPRLPPATPATVRVLASLNQLALYLVLLAQPLIGLIDTNAWGFPLDWFGLFRVPSPVGKQPEAVAQSLSNLHWYGAALLLALLALHVAGAAYHGLLRRDGVVRHMA